MNIILFILSIVDIFTSILSIVDVFRIVNHLFLKKDVPFLKRHLLKFILI